MNTIKEGVQGNTVPEPDMDSFIDEGIVGYKTLFNNMLNEVHVWRVVRDANGEIINWRLVDLNPAAEHAWGLKKEEVLGKTTDEIFSPEVIELFISIVREIFADGTAYKWQIYFPNLNQHLQMASFPVGGEHFVSTGTDVTELVEAREKAERALEAEAEAAGVIKASLDGTINALSSIVEARDLYTSGHEQRVAEIALQIGVEMGLSASQLKGLEIAAKLHDIGKIVLPADIISKPARLTVNEYAMVKEHAETGAHFLRGIDFGWPVADIVEQHHERWDGSGYPHQISGERILLEARIIGVADTLEAMAHHRPYREAIGAEAAVEEIVSGAGTRYDPSVVAACERLIAGGRLVL